MVMTDVGTGGVQSCENYTTVGSVSARVWSLHALQQGEALSSSLTAFTF